MSNPVFPYLRLPNGMYVTQDANGNLGVFSASSTEVFTITSAGKISAINSGATAGIGVPAVAGLYSQTGKTGAVTNAINFTPPAAAGTYRLNAYVDVTAWTTPASFTIVATYKNAEGTAKTVTMATNEDDGTASAVIDEVSGFAAVPFIFGIDNSATAITLSTTGTFTGSPVYDLFAVLEQFS